MARRRQGVAWITFVMCIVGLTVLSVGGLFSLSPAIQAQTPDRSNPTAVPGADLRGMLGNAGDGPGEESSRRSLTSSRPSAAPQRTGRTLGEQRQTSAEQSERAEPRRDRADDRRRSRARRTSERSYEITTSGRLRESSSSRLAYDGDPTTVWDTGDVRPAAYAWFDLGRQRPIGTVRWLAPTTSGPITIQVSNDRKSWTTVHVATQPRADAWDTAAIDQRGRYVRFLVSTQAGAAELAEVVILPPQAENPITVAEASQPARAGENRAPSVEVTNADGSRGTADVRIETPVADSEGPEITINGETTRCEGSGRCRVVGNAPEVVEACGDGTTSCTVNVSVSGGSATCDASGEDRKRNGGNQRSTCTAEASGGSVEVGALDR